MGLLKAISKWQLATSQNQFVPGINLLAFANCYLLTAICCSCPSTESQTAILTTSRRWRRLSRLPAHTLSQLCAQYLRLDQWGVHWLSWASQSTACHREPRQRRAGQSLSATQPTGQ